MNVAILGGTGPFGRALAARLVEAGVDVVIGSRDDERARAAAAELGCRGARNEAAVDGADLVVVAVEAHAALATVSAVRDVLRAPVLSVASRMEFSGGKAFPAPGATSLAEEIAEAVDVPVAAGLHTIAAAKLAAGRPDEDALICGNKDARPIAVEVAQKVVAGRAIDVGPLALARALEGLTPAIVNVNRAYKAHAGIRLTGL